MKKLLSLAAASLVFVGTANAQGTWYTDVNTWYSRLTSIDGIADFNSIGYGLLGSQSYTENGVTVSVPSTDGLWGTLPGHIGAVQSLDTLTVTFSGNAFGGVFLATDVSDNYIDVPLSFSTSDGGTYYLPSVGDTAPFTFLGYISDGSGPISLGISGAPNFAGIDEFGFGNGTNPTNPNTVVPEPGEYVSMAILGIGLCGMLVRSRRNKKS
jgi:hypothetical protein